MSQTITDLRGTLRMGDAEDLRATLAGALAQGDVRIVTEGLDALDSALVQVLLSARRTAAQLERNLQIDVHEGGALATLADRLALGTDFGPSVADAATA